MSVHMSPHKMCSRANNNLLAIVLSHKFVPCTPKVIVENPYAAQKRIKTPWPDFDPVPTWVVINKQNKCFIEKLVLF